MKKLALTLVVIFSLTTISFAQKQCKVIDFEKKFNSTFTIVNSNQSHSSIYVKGETANQLLYVLLKNKKRVNGYTHKINNIHIPQIQQAVSFKIIEGVHSYNENGNFYFHYYDNKVTELKYKSSLKSNQKTGIIVYVKVNGSKVVSKQNLQYIIDYFKSLI